MGMCIAYTSLQLSCFSRCTTQHGGADYAMNNARKLHCGTCSNYQSFWFNFIDV